MAKFLASGRRRDLVVLVYSLSNPREQELKRALETQYGERISPAAFYGAVEALVDHGFVQKTADGVHDRVSLTDAGETALLDHYEWLSEQIEPTE